MTTAEYSATTQGYSRPIEVHRDEKVDNVPQIDSASLGSLALTDRLVEFHPTDTQVWGDVMPAARLDMVESSRKVASFGVATVQDRYALDPKTQARVDATFGKFIIDPEQGKKEFFSYEGIRTWAPTIGRAIALLPVYESGKYKTLGCGFTADIFRRPIHIYRTAENDLVEGTAEQILTSEKGKDGAASVMAKLDKFFDGKELDKPSLDFFMGATDARAIRTRGTAAMSIIGEHLTRDADVANSGSYRVFSMGCAFVPGMAELSRDLKNKGLKLNRWQVVDSDVPSLALSSAILQQNEVDSESIDLVSHNILGNKPHNKLAAKAYRTVTELTLAAGSRNMLKGVDVEPGSCDVSEALGLVEYLPRLSAVSMLKQLKSITKPGGIVLTGNMVKENERPGQEFFSEVMEWKPKVQQRSTGEFLELAEAAGFDISKAHVVAPNNGVYVVYGLVA